MVRTGVAVGDGWILAQRDQAEGGQGVVGLVCGVIWMGFVGRESVGGVELAARPQAGGLPQFFARPTGVALAMQASR